MAVKSGRFAFSTKTPNRHHYFMNNHPQATRLTLISLALTTMEKTCLTLLTRLQEIEVEIVVCTNLPGNTPSLDLLAQHIHAKFEFIRNFFIAVISSYRTRLFDLSEIQQKITDLEEEFYGSDLHPVNVHRIGDSESGCGSGSDSVSVCESCLNNDLVVASSAYEAPEMLYKVVPPVEGVYESKVPPSDHEKVETFECKAEITDSGKRRRRRRRRVETLERKAETTGGGKRRKRRTVEMLDRKAETTGGGKKRRQRTVETLERKAEITGGGKRWRTVAILTTVSAGLMVSFLNYLIRNLHEDFLTPT